MRMRGRQHHQGILVEEELNEEALSVLPPPTQHLVGLGFSTGSLPSVIVWAPRKFCPPLDKRPVGHPFRWLAPPGTGWGHSESFQDSPLPSIAQAAATRAWEGWKNPIGMVHGGPLAALKGAGLKRAHMLATLPGGQCGHCPVV